MEIGNFSVGLGASGGLDWGWVQAKIRNPATPIDRQKLRSQLSDVLFGVQLNQLQLMEYRIKLAEVMALLDNLEAPAPPLPETARMPREARAFPVGPLLLRPSPPQFDRSELFTATPVQVLQKRKLLRLHDFFQREGETDLVSNQFRVAAGLRYHKGGRDRVSLSPAGLQEVMNPTQAPVQVLRLPPRIHKQVDILRAATWGTKKR